MSAGNTKTQGNKGNNFPFQFRNLQLLNQIEMAVASLVPPGGLATEATLQSVLVALQNGQEYEQNLVSDLGNPACPANCPTYLQVRVWNTVTHGFDPPVYYDATGAVVVPIGPLELVNPQYVLADILTQIIALNASVDVNLSTRASELTLAALNAAFTATNFATEGTLLLIKGVLDNIKLDTAKLDVNLSTRATEATLALIKAKTDNLDVALSTRATEATLALIRAKTDNIDVALSTRSSEATLSSLDAKFTKVSRTPLVIRATGVGTIAQEARSVSVYNGGVVTGSWLGVSIKQGEQLSFTAGGEDDTFPASTFTYDGTGTELVITVVY